MVGDPGPGQRPGWGGTLSRGSERIPIGILKSMDFFFLKIIYLFIYLWLCWVFVSARGLSPVAASGGHSSSRCVGLSVTRPLLLWSTDSRRAGSAIVAHGPSCSAACGILPDQGSNPCPLHWQADSQPLSHQGSPKHGFLKPDSLASNTGSSPPICAPGAREHPGASSP